MAQYGKQEYWNGRYSQDPDVFEWYQHWVGIKDAVAPSLSPESQLLIVGCGNSTLSEELYDEGYRNQVNIDFSDVVIKAMQEKYKDRAGMIYKQMDMRAMDFPDGVFNVVLDKASLDSVLCAEGSLVLAAKCLGEISRVLSPEGTFVSVSHGVPDNRMEILQKPEYGWSVSVVTVPKPMWNLLKDANPKSSENDDSRIYHYIYIFDLSRSYAKRRQDEPRSHYAQRLQFINALVADNRGMSDERIEVLSNCYTNVKFLNNRYHAEIMKILEKYDPEVRLVTESQQQSIAHIKTPK